ncbi:hypothetical protein VPH35_021182 [Triticum aestivum]
MRTRVWRRLPSWSTSSGQCSSAPGRPRRRASQSIVLCPAPPSSCSSGLLLLYFQPENHRSTDVCLKTTE